MRGMESFSLSGRVFRLEVEDIVWALGVGVGSLVAMPIVAIYLLLFI